MDRFFLVSIFCVLMFIASGCQRQERNTENLSAKEADVVIAPRWFKVADFKVEKAAARNSEVHVGTVGVRDKEGGVECQLLQEKPAKEEKWFPLSLRFLSPAQPGKKFSKAFADTLSFSKPSQNEKLFKFLVDFKKDAFKFASLWRVLPYLAKGSEGVYCSARAEICTDFVEEDGKLSCKAQWHWLKEIIAVPDLAAYFSGQGEKLASLKGVFYSQDNNGEVKVGEPITLAQ